MTPPKLIKNNLLQLLSKVNTPYQTRNNFKFTGCIPYKRIVETGLGDLRLDSKSWLILDYIKDWFFSNSKRKKIIIENGDTFVWINYRYMIKSLPTLHLTKPTISRRIKKLESLGFIKTKRINGKALYVSLTKLTIEIYRTEKLKQGVSLVKRSIFSNKDLSSISRPITKKSITININNSNYFQKNFETDTIAGKISLSKESLPLKERAFPLKTSSPLKEDTDLDTLLSRIAKRFNFDLDEIKKEAQERLERERKVYFHKMKADPNRVSLKEIQKTLKFLTNEGISSKSRNYCSYGDLRDFSSLEDVINEMLCEFNFM
jgi:DNA-binding MarR family transcriptional regulator